MTTATTPGGDAAAQQPTVESRVKSLLEVDGLRFRDLDGSGTLDPYEDWRLSAQERARDLVGRMTLEEKAGLMVVDTFNAMWGGEVEEKTAVDYLDTQNMRRLIFRNSVAKPGEQKKVDIGATGLSASSVSPTETARFMNAIQERVEGSRLGIPVLFKSNARNHIDPNARYGINEDVGGMSAFPKEAGMASAALGHRAGEAEGGQGADMTPVADFARVMGEEWHALGLRGMYGYMIDLSTEPRWYRTHETFTENADLMADIATTLVETLQGPVGEDGVSLSPTTDVALTMKHFPGGGPQEYGFDPHFSYGKTQVYPGDAFELHLEPFRAAIAAGVASLMPYYGVPMGQSYQGRGFPETGFAFSDAIVNGLLREDLGFRGYVNSDTGIINDRAWGLEHATVPERVATAINGGTETLSGFHDASVILDLVRDGLVSEERVDQAAYRLLVPMFQMGLFENPYVDAEAADSVVGKPANQEVGRRLQRDSLVLLKNEKAADGAPILPLRTGATVYTLGVFDVAELESRGYTVINGDVAEGETRPSAKDADVVLIKLTAFADNTADYRSDDPATGMNPEHVNPVVLPGVPGLDGKSPFGASDAGVWQGTGENTDDRLMFGGAYPWEIKTIDFTGMEAAESWEVSPRLPLVQEVMAEVGDPNKVVLDVYFRQPFVLDAASGLQEAGALVANFGVRDEALLDVLSGEYPFVGRMPFSLPASIEAVQEQYTDLPGYEQTADGALYEFGFGLRYEDDASA